MPAQKYIQIFNISLCISVVFVSVCICSSASSHFPALRRVAHLWSVKIALCHVAKLKMESGAARWSQLEATHEQQTITKNSSKVSKKARKTRLSGGYCDWVPEPLGWWAPATADKRRNWLLHLDTLAQRICTSPVLQSSSSANKPPNHQRAQQPVSEACGSRSFDFGGLKTCLAQS